jgi:hypothetical protein
MNIKRIRIVLPARLRRDADAAGRVIAERIAMALSDAGPESARSVTLPGHGRSADALARDAAGALARGSRGERSWR